MINDSFQSRELCKNSFYVIFGSCRLRGWNVASDEPASKQKTMARRSLTAFDGLLLTTSHGEICLFFPFYGKINEADMIRSTHSAHRWRLFEYVRLFRPDFASICWPASNHLTTLTGWIQCVSVDWNRSLFNSHMNIEKNNDLRKKEKSNSNRKRFIYIKLNPARSKVITAEKCPRHFSKNTRSEQVTAATCRK